MSVSTQNKVCEEVIGASVLAPVPAARMYETVRDVRSFPKWAPGVRRVEVFGNLGKPGMLSEWEVSFLGLRKRILSVLEEAEHPGFLRWTYEGPVTGWGECSLEDRGRWTFAEFRTVVSPSEPGLERLMRGRSVRRAATTHLKHALFRLGELVAGEERVVVGPLAESGRTQ